MKEKISLFTNEGLKQFIKRTAQLMDKKIDAIPVIDSLYDDDLAVGESEQIIIRTIKKVHKNEL